MADVAPIVGVLPMPAPDAWVAMVALHVAIAVAA
jgi:hypothetical protein